MSNPYGRVTKILKDIDCGENDCGAVLCAEIRGVIKLIEATSELKDKRSIEALFSLSQAILKETP